MTLTRQLPTLTVDQVAHKSQVPIRQSVKHIRHSYPAAIRVYAGDSLHLYMRGGAVQWHVLKRFGAQDSQFMLASVTTSGEVVEHSMNVKDVMALIAEGVITHKRPTMLKGD